MSIDTHTLGCSCGLNDEDQAIAESRIPMAERPTFDTARIMVSMSPAVLKVRLSHSGILRKREKNEMRTIKLTARSRSSIYRIGGTSCMHGEAVFLAYLFGLANLTVSWNLSIYSPSDST